MIATIPIFIISYHRADNLKSLRYWHKIGYPMELLHIVIDSEADDAQAYKELCDRYKCHLHIFDMTEARCRYDYVHRPTPSRRSAGQARNMIYDIAPKLGLDFYMVQDDDTMGYQLRPFSKYIRAAKSEEIIEVFEAIREFMERRHVGIFGVSQTGDLFEKICTKLIRLKVMNTTFVCTKYIYRGERGVQDDDTSMFVGVMNEGYFTASMASGIVLQQTASATSKGGLTDLYNECKLLNKALVCPIQYPSAIWGERQKRNGGRLHHRVNYRYLMPKILKGVDPLQVDNIAWDTFPEDGRFTNEPKRINRVKAENNEQKN